MRNYTNIERSAFRKDEYIGHACGLVFHIRKDGREWIAYALGSGLRPIVCPSLAMMSVALENVII